MTDLIYQNQDQSSQNPIAPDSIQPTLNLPKNIDPKVKLLIILVVVTVILLIVSLIVTSVRKRQPRTFVRSAITPTQFQVKPTDIPEASVIPPAIKEKFDAVDSQNQININFPPPQIDPDIGL
jgi:hypothetical protein